MKHFVEELGELKRQLLEMGGLVEAAVYGSVAVLTEKDPSHATQVLANEARINQLQIEIDEAAIRLLALQQPMASDLRLITAAIKINTDLERMADLAVNIVAWSQALVIESRVIPAVDIPQMAQQVESMVRKSLDAFVQWDAGLARKVLISDDAVDDLRDSIYNGLIAAMEADPAIVRQAVPMMFVAHNLERIADHATNIAEDVLFLVQGIEVRHHAEAHMPRS